VSSIEQLIRQQINPFNPTTFTPGNFWQESQDESQEVSSIHQEVMVGVEQALEALGRDRKTRTLMLIGDSGSGKSYLLGRLKRQLNDRACFAYISPWPDSEFIWRHLLRQTVDSLIEVPAGQRDPQLIRWLKGLAVLNQPSFAKRMLGERSVFVRDMRASFPSGLYRPKDFFGVLYELLNPDHRMVAYDWLRGEDLDEEDLKLLKVKRSIDSEDAAQKILANFGKIADSTQPIVICFDNLDNIPKRADGKTDLQALFDVNTTIHNEKLNNFLILISIISGNWQANKNAVEIADRQRIDRTLWLRAISLDQAEAIWASRLLPLHSQAQPKPASAIAPLTRQWLEHKYPGGKIVPRAALMLAESMIRYFKEHGKIPAVPPSQPPASPFLPSRSATGQSTLFGKSNSPKRVDPQVAKLSPVALPPPPQNVRASFELTWQKEFKETSQQIRRMAQFSSPELIRRLHEVLEALAVSDIRLGILPSPSYKSYSLGYALGYQRAERIGIVWSEDGNLSAFCTVMKACQKMVDSRQRDRLYLIRSASLGTPKNKGHQLFQAVFSSGNGHIKPDLESVKYLETYHRLLNAAAGRELVIASQTPDINQLQQLVRESEVLFSCSLLQHLGIVPANLKKTFSTAGPTQEKTLNKKTLNKKTAAVPSDERSALIESAQRYILTLMTVHSIMGSQALVKSVLEQEPTLRLEEIEQIIQSLCQSHKLRMLDPKATRENQLLCWVPT
jgi:hypothetical protein